MNFKKAACEILRREQKSLSPKEITNIALREKLITSSGKTPQRTMASEIYKDINKLGNNSPFIKIERGKFGLRDFDKHLAKVEKITNNFQRKGKYDLVELLAKTQIKSESPTEYEEAIKDAFIFLGFEGELIGGSGDTDVLLTANLGQKSFKVNVDGKTSKSGKIIDRQIDWLSLSDHRKKNRVDFVIVVGPSFAEGNVISRANDHHISLLTTEKLIRLIQAHSNFPFTLFELKDLFTDSGLLNTQLEDLLSQNHSRRILLEQFKTVIEEMQSLQDRLGYFTFDSLAGREKIENLEIDPKDIEYIISLLRLPFINGVKEIENNKYVLAINIRDIANIFRQISSLLAEPEETIPIQPPEKLLKPEKEVIEKRAGSKYYAWTTSGQSIVAEARKEKPYKHHCPIEHFETILGVIKKAYKTQDIVSTDLIFSMLEGKEIAPNRIFKGKPEDYKIRMVLGILEIEGLIKWTGSKRPIEYKLEVSLQQIDKWYQEKIKKNPNEN